MSEYEKKMLAQLTLDLLQLKASLEQNTKLNEERVKEYAHFCSEIANLSAEDEFLLIEIDQLEVYGQFWSKCSADIVSFQWTRSEAS